ncbi:hypothetical protein [Brachybacterium sp. UMB0905]|uniref:hypothetical protein n=1 Tax=Brachybacterium sp. UMB0905 TaxID=2069310 RepID=UPI000C802E18|nr:hypothetical protein [Brachybacterium sp. UMB0905]PMC76380.1 hypothetical protein CJ197_04285 [Brachybacterium sp. UMB0905]
MTISPENLTAWRTEAEHVITNSSPINDITDAARIIALLNALEQAEQELADAAAEIEKLEWTGGFQTSFPSPSKGMRYQRERDEARAELAKADAQIEELNTEAQTYSDALSKEIARAEKAEQERDEAKRSECPDKDVHWRYIGLLDELNEMRHQRYEARARADQAEARAEKAEQEVEHLRTVLDTTARQRDEADKRVTKVVKERDQAIADQHMTADQHLAAAVAHGVTATDEMVERARLAYNAIYPSGAWVGGIRAALTAALTKPQRPDGAEEIERLLTENLGDFRPPVEPEAIADLLASRGVRVVGEEQP